jgi:hypothetical protein
MSATLETLLTFSVAVIAALLLVIPILLIPVLLQIRRSTREACKLIGTIRLQIAPVSRDIVLISQEVRTIIHSIHLQVDRVEDDIETVRHTAIRLRTLQLEVIRRIAKPLLQLAAVMGGMKRSMGAMARMFGR